jgi:phosphohistidine phosphatase
VRLILVRHAEAAPGEPDELRPLTSRGRAQARELAGRLPRPDAVLTSPLRRARETAALLASPHGLEPDPDGRLAPGASDAEVLEAIAGRGETVVVVGHQPDCGIVASRLGAGEVRFPPAGHCVVEL